MLVKEEKERRGYQKQARQDKHEVPRKVKAAETETNHTSTSI